MKKIKKKKRKFFNKKKFKKKNRKKFKKNKIKKKKILKKKVGIKLKKKKNKESIYKVKKPSSFLLKIVRFQNNLKNNFPLKFNFDFFKIDSVIQSFFQNIDDKISEYKILKADEIRKAKIKKLEQERSEKERIKKEKIEQEEKILKERIKQVKDEEQIEKKLSKDIKLFLRKEQAILRKEQAERQKRFLQELKLEQQIEKFRIREVKELEKLERISLKEKRDDYEGLQDRIEKLKQKYRQIRDQKIRERVESLGIKTLESDDRETLLRKEREYSIERQKIELSLESFYRSAASLVFQLNKRHITRHMSIFRCVDRRFETGEIFIKWDETNDEDWLILIYIKDNSPDKGIVIEDKTNPEKNYSHEFKSNEIFKASDTMVDSLTQLLSRERQRK